MFYKKPTKLLMALTLLSLLLFTACDSGSQPASPTPTAGTSGDPAQGSVTTPTPQDVGITAALTSFDQETDWDSSAVSITLDGNTADITGDGCVLDNSVLSITQAGTYVLSGSFNGQLYVSVDKIDKVHLVLNNASITCSDGPAVYIASADKVSITLADGTDNTLTDGSVYSATGEGAPNACLLSKDDLSINGNGTLTVNANYHNGIDTSNDLRIVSGTINVTAKNHGLKGNDSVVIMGGNISVNAGKDGVKADTIGEDGKGFFYMNGGTLHVTAVDDGIQAVTSIRIDSGSVSFNVPDDATNCDGTTAIAEGVIQQ